MRMTFSLLALTSLVASLTAQAPPTNQFGIYPEATTFTSRSGIAGADAGDILTEIGTVKTPGPFAENLCAVGQLGAALPNGRVNGFRLVIQDQNAATQENFNHVILPLAAAGGPDPTPANEILRTGNIQLPVGPASPTAFLVTNTLTTPADVLPQAGTYYFGEGIEANTAWTADGLSVHAASYTTGTVGANPGPTAPNLTYTISRAGGPGTLGVVNPPPTARVHRRYILTEGRVLNAGADIVAASQRGPNPSFGAAGLYPDRARADGLAFQYNDAAGVGETCSVLGSLLGFGPPLPLPVLDGVICLNPIFIVGVFTTFPVTGSDTVIVAPTPQPIPLGRLSYQAVTVGALGVRLSNGTSSEDS